MDGNIVSNSGCIFRINCVEDTSYEVEISWSEGSKFANRGENVWDFITKHGSRFTNANFLKSLDELLSELSYYDISKSYSGDNSVTLLFKEMIYVYGWNVSVAHSNLEGEFSWE